MPPVRDSSLKPYSPTVPGAGLLCLPGAFPKWDSSALVSPHPPVLGPHCSPGIPQCWATAPQFSPRSQMMSQGQDSGVPHQAPSCAPPPPPHPMLFRGHRLGPSLLPVWVMSLLLGNLGELGGWAGWAWTGGGGSPLRGWGGVGRDAPACLGAGRGPGQAVSALVREQGRLFLFHFPPMESPERELAVCLGGLVGLGDALSPFPCLAFSRAMGCGHSSPLASLTPFLLLCLRSSHRL